MTTMSRWVRYQFESLSSVATGFIGEGLAIYAVWRFDAEGNNERCVIQHAEHGPRWRQRSEVEVEYSAPDMLSFQFSSPTELLDWISDTTDFEIRNREDTIQRLIQILM